MNAFITILIIVNILLVATLIWIFSIVLHIMKKDGNAENKERKDLLTMRNAVAKNLHDLLTNKKITYQNKTFKVNNVYLTLGGDIMVELIDNLGFKNNTNINELDILDKIK